MSEPIQLKVSGTNIARLNAAASFVEQELEKINGVGITNVNRMLETKEYYLALNNTRLNTSGLTKLEVQNELNIAVMGREISTYRKESKEYPVKLRSNMRSVADMDNFMIASSFSSIKHPVRQFSDIRLSSTYDMIHRFNGNRAITISATPKAGYSADAIQKELMQILSNESFHDITFIYEGENELLDDIYGRLMVGVIVAVSAIIILLLLEFNSVKQTAIVLFSIPSCFIGATIGLVVMNQNLSFLTMLGILSLVGIVINNDIILIDHINEQRKNGSSTLQACKQAVSRRFRPIMLSTVTTVLGLLPLVITRDLLFEGMAIAIMSGLLVSTLFTVIVVPMLYSILFKDKPA
jgi:multidrug efflux pump subunit AcrB